MATILQVIGAALITIGVALVFLPAGLVVGGAAALLFGIAMERGNAQ